MTKKLTYVATFVVLDVVESVPDLPAHSNDRAAVSLRHELVGRVVVVEVVLEALRECQQHVRAYNERDERLERARLDHDAVVAHIHDDTVEHLTFEGLHDKCLEEDAVDNFP